MVRQDRRITIGTELLWTQVPSWTLIVMSIAVSVVKAKMTADTRIVADPTTPYPSGIIPWLDDVLLPTMWEEKESSSVGLRSKVNTEQLATERSPLHPLAIAANDLYKYGMTVLFIIGSVGNFLAIAVLCRKRLRNSSGTLYLLVLGFIDQYNIFAAVLGSHVIRSYSGFDWIRYDRVLCKLGYFTIVACAQTAFYLVAAMSMERAIVVSNPLKHMHTFTRKRTVLIIITIMLVWLVKNLEKFWSMGAIYKEDENGTLFLDRECGITANTVHWSIDIRPWLDYVITFAAALIIILCNIVIITKVKHSGKLQKSMSVKDGGSSKANQMVPMLVTTSLVFLVLALPLQIVTIIYPSNPNDATTASAGKAKLLWSFGLLTNYMNNGVNFYTYCVSGKMFRQELVDMFHCRSSDDKYKTASTASVNTKVSVISNAQSA